MLILDRARAIDLMISRSERVRIPEPFGLAMLEDPMQPAFGGRHETDAGAGRFAALTNFLTLIKHDSVPEPQPMSPAR